MRCIGHEKCIQNGFTEKKFKWKRPLGRPGHRSGDNIKIDLREIRWKGVNWSQMAQGRVQ
jgi:hypothetical protein